MDVRAIVLIGGRPTIAGAAPQETFAGIPAAYLDVLGEPVVSRIVHRLQRFGVSCTALISDASDEAETFARCAGVLSATPRVRATGEEFWQAVEAKFQEFSEGGAELVILARLGPYVEIDYEELIQHHLDKRCAVTAAVDSNRQSFNIYVLNASARKDASTLFRSRLKRFRRECEPYRVTAYSNRLQDAADLRRLGLDGLMGVNSIKPAAKETKPGVWVARSARIHDKARVVAPAYIGASAKIRASALITRGTIVEQHAEVDCGSVVENSTILPYTCVGAGLDVMHAVAGFRRLMHLPRRVEVEISDARLLGMAPWSKASRIAGSTAAVFAFLPKQMYRAAVAAYRRKPVAHISGASEQTAQPSADPATEAPGADSESSEFPSNLAVARRYGDH